MCRLCRQSGTYEECSLYYKALGEFDWRITKKIGLFRSNKNALATINICFQSYGNQGLKISHFGIVSF